MTSLRTIRRTLAILAVSFLFQKALDAQPVDVTIEVDEAKPGSAIPADFLGFSYEKNVLALDHFKPSNAAMVNLMRHLGSGVLRMGANYVEITRWEPEATKSFSNKKSLISTRELEEPYQFARASRWTVIHGLNLGANEPAMAADETAAAQRIGGQSLLAFEIGNEPEHYGKTWRPADYCYQDFSREISSYLDTMRPKGQRIPLAGPATTSNFPWFTGFIRDFRSDLVMTCRHNYPLAAATTDPANTRFATIEHLLSPDTAADAKTGITLGGSGVASDGTWQPKPSEPVTASEGEFLINVPAASAAMLVVGRENSARAKSQKSDHFSEQGIFSH